MMRVAAIVLSFQLVAALQYRSDSVKLEQELDSQIAQADDEPECNGCKYAYVTMWIAQDELPKSMIKKKWQKKNGFKVSEGEGSADGTYVDSNEAELLLSDQMESDAMEYESELAKFTNHLSGKDAIWELAGNLASVGSQYPLLVLTNEKKEAGILAQQEELKAKYPNVQIVELKDYLFPKCTMRHDTITHFQKLNVLGMDHYDKLLWIDVDIRLRKSIDYTFNLNVDRTTYFMKDDWYCGSQPMTNGGYSSGLMLFKPNKKVLEHTLATSDKMVDCWGDQTIIQHAFKKEIPSFPAEGETEKMNMKWIPSKTIRYPQCDKRHTNDHADAIHFVKVKKGFVTPDAIYNPEDKEM